MRRRFGRIIGDHVDCRRHRQSRPEAITPSAKAGMIGMMKSLAQEYAKRGVTANCIAPGFIATPMTDKLNEKQREAILGRVPAGRLGVRGGHCGGGWFILPPTKRLMSPARTSAREWRNGNDLSVPKRGPVAGQGG